MSAAVPQFDESVARLRPEQRHALARYWARRARSELGARSGFAVIERALASAPSAPVVRELAAQALADERRHAQLCLELAALYGGRSVPTPTPAPFDAPRYGVEPELEALLQVIGMCCVNESLAVVFLQACVPSVESPQLRAVQRRHLADEVQHARLGWAHLAWVPAGLRARAREWVAPLIDTQRSAWRERVATLPEEGYPGHGLPPRAVIEAELMSAVDRVLVPGFAYLGVRV
ncbi:MAG: ferritin-like domain-containing protein [Myxococcales bacterium]|nr:ferritin-like domain-containing protein [Myxococcales bacterium]